ncbi:hypothetical protein CAPTEDRAFT_69649, partial [Capitella teleta]
GTCPDGSWTKRGSYCYLAECTPRNAEQARERCASYNATLASVHDLDEHLFIDQLCKIASTTYGKTCDNMFYLGLTTNDQGQTWVWDYYNWDVVEPDSLTLEYCAVLNVVPNKGWANIRCNREEAFICKK